MCQRFQGPVGLPFHSFRKQLSSDVPATLEKVRRLGVEYVEPAVTYTLTPEHFKKNFDARGHPANRQAMPCPLSRIRRTAAPGIA